MVTNLPLPAFCYCGSPRIQFLETISLLPGGGGCIRPWVPTARLSTRFWRALYTICTPCVHHPYTIRTPSAHHDSWLWGRNQLAINTLWRGFEVALGGFARPFFILHSAFCIHPAVALGWRAAMRDFHAWPGTTGLRILHSSLDILPSSSGGRFAASQAVWGRYGVGMGAACTNNRGARTPFRILSQTGIEAFWAPSCFRCSRLAAACNCESDPPK